MTSDIKTGEEILEEKRSSSLEDVLKSALPYHFSNFEKFERLGVPYAKDGEKIGKFAERMKANTLIKFEVQAYINHLRRLKHHIKYLEKND